MGIAIGIVIAEHTVDFRSRVIAEPEVVQHRITNLSRAVPPPPGNATAVTAPGAELIRLITAIGRNPSTRLALMDELGPGIETTSCRQTLAAARVRSLTIR